MMNVVLMRSFDFRMWVQYVLLKPHVRNWRHDFSLLPPPNMFFIQTFCLSLQRLLAWDTGECFRLFEKVNAAEDVQFRCLDCDRRFVLMVSRNAADMPTILILLTVLYFRNKVLRSMLKCKYCLKMCWKIHNWAVTERKRILCHCRYSKVSMYILT